MFQRIAINRANFLGKSVQTIERTFCTKNSSPQREICKYTPKHIQTEKEQKRDMYVVSFMLLGGFIGGCKIGSETYAETKQDKYVRCVRETTMMGIAGFCGGVAATVLLPVIIPIGPMVAMARYLDTPESPPPKVEPNSDRNYCVHPRMPR